MVDGPARLSEAQWHRCGSKFDGNGLAPSAGG
jgi:hypothetical protein